MIHEIESDNGVVELVLDMPPVNALGIGHLGELAAAFRGIDARPSARAVILRGEGPGFCGGGDVKEVQVLPEFSGILGQALGSEATCVAVATCPVPVVAAVHGYCIGVGALIVACADILVAAHGTRFVLAEVDNGATGGAAQMANLLPERRVRRAMLTGEAIDAGDLERHGSAMPLVDEADLISAARAVADQLAAKSPSNLRRMKQSLHASAPVEAMRARYRQELSYTYELNLSGEAFRSREATVDRLRSSDAGIAPRPRL